MSRLTKFIMMSLVGTLMLGTTAFAAEGDKGYVVTPTSAVGYTNVDTVVMADATLAGAVVLNAEQCPDAIPLLITGITDTGFWEVDLGQVEKFYIAGPLLENITLIGGGNGNGAVGNNGGGNGNVANSDNGTVINTGATVNNAVTNNTVANNGATGNGLIVYNASGEAYVDSNCASAIVKNTAVVAGEEECIQWLLANAFNTVKNAYDIEMCRYFYRECYKLYEQVKANPNTYVSYWSGYYEHSINEYASWVTSYFNKTYNNLHFGPNYKHPSLDRLCGYRVDPNLLENAGIFMK